MLDLLEERARHLRRPQSCLLGAMDLLVPGCRVLLTDLVSREDLNGEEALLLRWIDDRQRWAVRLVNKTAEGLKVKPANVVRSPSGFDCLNEDALLLALVRTSMSSHQPLFSTNWRIRKVIHSPEFFRSRLRLGFANVAVRLDPKERGYDEERGLENEDGGWIESDPDDDDDDDDDELGYEGDYECTRHFSASILADDMPVGSFSCTLINRTACRTHRVFLSACDAESQELVDIGRVLFDEMGEPRTAALKADPETKRGGFLYIREFSLPSLARWYPQELGTTLYFPEEGATDVSSQAIKQLLALDELEYRWSVAAYIAWVRQGREEADDEQMKKGLASECHHFVRANFQEIESRQASEGWIYTTKALQLLPRLSHREALSVPLKFAAAPSKPLRPEPAGADAKLKEALTQYNKTPSLEEIDLLLRAVRKQWNPVVWSTTVQPMPRVRVAGRNRRWIERLALRCVQVEPGAGHSASSAWRQHQLCGSSRVHAVDGRCGNGARQDSGIGQTSRGPDLHRALVAARRGRLADRRRWVDGSRRLSQECPFLRRFQLIHGLASPGRKSISGSNTAPSWRTHARR